MLSTSSLGNQGADERGAHVNISGGGVTLRSKNKSNAIKLLEFLVSEEAQMLYGKISMNIQSTQPLLSRPNLKYGAISKKTACPSVGWLNWHLRRR